jgi:hypothetical protein
MNSSVPLNKGDGPKTGKMIMQKKEHKIEDKFNAKDLSKYV